MKTDICPECGKKTVQRHSGMSWNSGGGGNIFNKSYSWCGCGWMGNSYLDQTNPGDGRALDEWKRINAEGE